MRELVFALQYEPGANRLADTLADYPGARIRSRSLYATSDSLWRVDQATGPSGALSEIGDAFLATDFYAGCLATDTCGATQRTEILDHTDDVLVFYSYWKRTPVCESVPHTALDYLGEGSLFETRSERRRYTWRIVHPSDGDVRGFFDHLERAIGDRAGMDVKRLTDASSPTDHADGSDELPREQAEALRAAVEHGYYETPREVNTGDLADELDVPRSTLTYRLRRAEAKMAEERVARMRPREWS